MAGIDVISDTTGKDILEQMKRQNTLLSVISGASQKDFIQSWDAVAQAVAGGYGPSLFSIGSTFTEPWKDTADSNKEYDNPWRVNHFSDVELQDGTTVPGMWLQNVYAHPFGVAFSNSRAFYACPDGLAAGTYNVGFNANWSANVVKGKVYQFTLTKAVEKGGRLAGFLRIPDTTPTEWKVYSYGADGKTLSETVVVTEGSEGTALGMMEASTRSENLNCFQEVGYGSNSWKNSAIRQYLNSSKPKGEWWTPQDQWDIAPGELATKDGFLCGMDQEMLNNILPVKTVTYKNTAGGAGADDYDVTYDKVNLISLEQMYINPQHAGEGEAHEYWKRVNGTSTKWQQWQTYPILKHYAVENHASAQYVRLRSAYLSNAINTWYVFSSGGVSSSYASWSHRFSPLVVIGKSK